MESSNTTAGQGERALRNLGLLGVVPGWIGVVIVEVVSLPNESLLTIIVPPAELTLWLVAGWLTLLLLNRASCGRLVVAATALVLAASCLHFTNWGAFHPTSYYATHRYAFAAVAAGVRNGSIGISDEYYGAPLPWYLRDVSTTGAAAVIGRQHGRPVVFLPQWLGIPDDAGGYVFVASKPDPDLLVDLFGDAELVVDGIDLGNGWWYLPGD